MKPKVRYQGKAIVEKNDGRYLMMTPDGEISFHATPDEVEAHAKKWAKRHSNKRAINALEIEWRNGR